MRLFTYIYIMSYTQRILLKYFTITWLQEKLGSRMWILIRFEPTLCCVQACAFNHGCK